MQKLSEIKNLTSSKKEQLLQELVPVTGLTTERLTKMYESFEYEVGGDFDLIIEKFDAMLTPKSFSFEEFKNAIIEINDNQDFSIEARQKITDKLISIINQVSVTADINILLEVVRYILQLKSEKFVNLQNNLDFIGDNISQLFEDTTIDFSKTNILTINADADNHINAAEDKRFFESLKTILARNNGRWGNNYHLDNVYKTIVSFLDAEITQIVNDDNLVTIDDNFHLDLIKQMLTQEQLNPMYRNIDVLRTLIPDMQTLIFDCMLLVHNYVSCNQSIMEFLSRHTYLDYIESTKSLYAAISSSKERSKIAQQNVIWKTKETSEFQNEPLTIAGIGFSEIFNNFHIDPAKIDTWSSPVRLNTAVDCVHIIKGAETDVNLPLRKILNIYVTKAMNILRSTEKQILENRKTNKYKSNY